MVGFTAAMKRSEAIVQAINAGCDMLLFTKNLEEDYETVLEAVKSGIISEERLNEAVTYILATKASLKLHEKQKSHTLIPDESALDILRCKKHIDMAYQVSDKAITLVKDEQNLLPLSKDKYKKVLTIVLGDTISASGKPAVNEELCRGCRRCAKECGSDAITYPNKKAVIDYDKCKGCGRCIGACSFDAIYNPNYNANELLDRKMAEYAQAVCYDRPCFHISLVQDISPNCDCHGENDAPILPDIGMFASFDPVALDQACADACLKATPIADSQLGEHLAEPGWHCHHDHFKDSNPNIEWQATLDQAEKIGLGTRQYELKRI